MTVGPADLAQASPPQPLDVLNKLLSSDDADPVALRERLDGLSDDELSHYGLRAYRMNLMALLGGRWSVDAIARTARQAALSKMWLGWEYHHSYLPRLSARPMRPQLHGLPFEAIRSLLAKGRGLVIASFHLGHMRHLPSDLAHAGIPVLVPLARDAYGNYESARQGNPEAALWRHFRPICVEDAGGTIALARGLARGACVISTIDGNTGTDGPRGGERRSIVTMLDTRVRVKNGLIAMAAKFGAPVLPLIATTVDGQRMCHSLPPMDPGRPLAGAEAERYVETTVGAMYAWLADCLLRFAHEWCGGDLFHQWRVPRAIAERPLAEVESRLLDDLRDGGRLLLDTGRVLPLPGQRDRVFVDVHTMRCCRFPEREAEFADMLLDPQRGVGLRWIESLGETRRSSVLRFLCLMASRELTTVRRETASLAP